MTIVTRNIVDYGASPSATPQANRIAIQAAIDASDDCDIIYVPIGIFVVERPPAPPPPPPPAPPPQRPPYSLRILGKTKLTFRGESRAGSVIAMSAEEAADTGSQGRTNRLFYVSSSPELVFEHLQLAGNKEHSGTPTEYNPRLEHHHAFFVETSDHLRFSDLYIHDFTGDGIQLYNAATDVVIEDSTVEHCQRDGISLAPGNRATPVERVEIRNCLLRGSSNQQIDNEHAPANHVEIHGCTLEPDGLFANKYVMALAGANAAAPSRHWHIHDNQINGPIVAVWASDVIVENNSIQNPNAKACIELSRNTTNWLIRNNDCRMLQTSQINQAVIYASGTTTSGPRDIVISHNKLRVDHPPSFGIRCDGCVSVEIRNNEISGAGGPAPQYAGIRLRTSVESRDFVSALITNNEIRDFGDAGIAIAGNLDARFLYAEIWGNRLFNSALPGPMKTAISLDVSALKKGIVTENVFGDGIVTPISPASLPPSIVTSFPPNEEDRNTVGFNRGFNPWLNGSTLGATPMLQSLLVNPRDFTWRPQSGDEPLQFIAIGLYSQGPPRDLTPLVAWSSDTPGTGTINADGEMTAVSAGTTSAAASTQITAVLASAGLSASTTLWVDTDRDTASGKRVPINAYQWSLGGYTVHGVYDCSEDGVNRPNLIDTGPGLVTLMASGGPQYQRPVPGWSRRGVAFDGTADQQFSVDAAAGLDPAAVDQFWAWYVYIPDLPLSIRGIATQGADCTVSQLPTGALQKVTSSAQPVLDTTTRPDQGGNVHPIGQLQNVTNARSALFTDAAKTIGTYAVVANGPKGISSGPWSGATIVYLYGWRMRAEHARLSDAAVKAIYQWLGFTVPWSPI
jgi:hypothetical protein